MTEASERRCCSSMPLVLHVCELASVACVTQLPVFQTNCLNLSVIQLAFYEQHEKRQQQLPKPIHESVRSAHSLLPLVTFLALLFSVFVSPFTALALLVGWQEGHPAHKN